MKVKSLKFNWHQVGSTETRDGAGEDWERFTIGEKGVQDIEENAPCNGMELWNYVVTLDDGTIYRVFNPNFVEYFKEESEIIIPDYMKAPDMKEVFNCLNPNL